MPADLHAFAANSENHDLNSPNSLHDAWLKEWTIAEIALPHEPKKRSIEINARFLGPQHDRYIHLIYKNVGSYTIQNPEDFEMLPHIAHGDLLIHELTVVRDGLFEHELRFSRGTLFAVQFSGFEHRIAIIPAT